MLLAVTASLALSAAAQPNSDANTRKAFKGYALSELGASGLLYNARAKEIYLKALGPLSTEAWLARLDGPSPQNRPIKVAGADYVLVAACKNRDCEQNNVVLLWSGQQDVVYGNVFQKGRTTLIGSPPPQVAAELAKLWKVEWRSQPK